MPDCQQRLEVAPQRQRVQGQRVCPGELDDRHLGMGGEVPGEPRNVRGGQRRTRPGTGSPSPGTPCRRSPPALPGRTPTRSIPSARGLAPSGCGSSTRTWRRRSTRSTIPGYSRRSAAGSLIVVTSLPIAARSAQVSPRVGGAKAVRACRQHLACVRSEEAVCGESTPAPYRHAHIVKDAKDRHPLHCPAIVRGSDPGAVHGWEDLSPPSCVHVH